MKKINHSPQKQARRQRALDRFKPATSSDDAARQERKSIELAALKSALSV